MESIWSILSECTPYIITLLALLILSEQISYLKRKSFAPGPTMVIPFMGNAISLVRNPKKFWDNQSALAQSTPLGVSTNYVFGKFIVYIYSTEFSHKVFSNIRPDAFQLTANPFGKKLWGERNIIYLFGQEHKDLRQRIAPNFTPKGIAFYNSIQQCIILKHLKSWLLKSNQKPIPLRLLSRYMNLDISQTVFVGEYLSDEERKMFNIGFDIFNEATMKLPINLPGFTFRNARSSHAKIIQMLAVCISKSEMKLKNSQEPTCLLDFWMLENLKVLKAEAEENRVVFEYSHEELADHFFNILFPAQDASTSSLIWAVTLLDAHPDVLQRVRLEVAKYWNPESDEPITVENLREMKFTEAVAKEVVRIRPPASMVPHIAQEDFALTKNYVIPKGAIVFPSVIDSCFQGFPEPEKFDPDRFMDERQEDKVYKRNFLPFGVGPHQCVGQRYALNHLKLFIAMFATLMEFKRARVDGCDDIVYLPSTFPKDDCSVILSQRCKRFPSLS